VNLNPDLVPSSTVGRTVIFDLGVSGQNVLDRNPETNLEGVPGVYVQNSPRVISPVDAPVSRYKHIWDWGRAAGRPRVVFVKKIHSPFNSPTIFWCEVGGGDSGGSLKFCFGCCFSYFEKNDVQLRKRWRGTGWVHWISPQFSSAPAAWWVRARCLRTRGWPLVAAAKSTTAAEICR
jgi:hypothetical protein